MPSPLADQWARAAAGDAEAFAVFYERHADRVYMHCYTRLRSQADAEDLTADVFATAWARREKVRVHDEVDILPWLLTTANHLLSRHQRAATTGWRLLRRVSSPEHEPDIAVDVVEQDALARKQALALSVLSMLRPKDREIIELCVLHGLSPATIAAETGVSASTVRNRLARALTRARRAYRAANLQESNQNREVAE